MPGDKLKDHEVLPMYMLKVLMLLLDVLKLQDKECHVPGDTLKDHEVLRMLKVLEQTTPHLELNLMGRKMPLPVLKLEDKECHKGVQDKDRQLLPSK